MFLNNLIELYTTAYLHNLICKRIVLATIQFKCHVAYWICSRVNFTLNSFTLNATHFKSEATYSLSTDIYDSHYKLSFWNVKMCIKKM